MLISPLVSVIIPVYNVEPYLDVCLESVINQTYKNLEIILVNDGSTDKSGDMCVKLAEDDIRIKVFHKPNEGLSSARNIGLKYCSGDYICFLDSDDWIELETVSCAVDNALVFGSEIIFWSYIKEYLDRSERIPLFNTNVPFINFEGRDLITLKRRMIGLVGDELAFPTKTDALVSAWGKLYKRSIIFQNRLEFIDTHIVGSEDVPFNVQTFHFAHKITFLNNYFNHYRMFNENSLTKNHGNTLFPRFKNLYFILLDLIERHGLGDDYICAVKNRFALSLINNALSITSKRYISPFRSKINDIILILNDDNYIECINKLPIRRLPFIWRIFFSLAKNRIAIGIYLVTMSYRKIKNI